MGKTRVDVTPDVRITMPGDSTGCISTAHYNSLQSVLRVQSLNKKTGCNTIETDNTGYISSGKASWESFSWAPCSYRVYIGNTFSKCVNLDNWLRAITFLFLSWKIPNMLILYLLFKLKGDQSFSGIMSCSALVCFLLQWHKNIEDRW